MTTFDKFQLWKKLFTACLNGDSKTTRWILNTREGLEIMNKWDFTDCWEMTSLDAASMNGHVDCVKNLIQCGVLFEKNFSQAWNLPKENFCQKDSFEKYSFEKYEKRENIALSTSLMIAVHGGQVECVKLLVEAGAPVDTMSIYGTALCIEESYFLEDSSGYSECMKILISAGANVNLRYRNRNSPLIQAVKSNDIELVRLLIENGADVTVDYVGDSNHSLLHASEWGFSAIVQMLVTAGANVNDGGINKTSPLILAAQHRHVKCVQILVEAGADLNAKDPNDSTALMIAAERGCEECVQILVEAGADLNAKDTDEFTALMIAVQQGYKNCASILVEAGADLHAKDSYGWTALALATEDGELEMVSSFLPKANDSDKRTSLFLAAGCEEVQCFELIWRSIH